jgi:hypothetical protein
MREMAAAPSGCHFQSVSILKRHVLAIIKPMGTHFGQLGRIVPMLSGAQQFA